MGRDLRLSFGGPVVVADRRHQRLGIRIAKRAGVLKLSHILVHHPG
jgi:hypothetical protein